MDFNSGRMALCEGCSYDAELSILHYPVTSGGVLPPPFLSIASIFSSRSVGPLPLP